MKKRITIIITLAVVLALTFSTTTYAQSVGSDLKTEGSDLKAEGSGLVTEDSDPIVEDSDLKADAKQSQLPQPGIPAFSDSQPDEPLTFWIKYDRNTSGTMDCQIKVSSYFYPNCFKYKVCFTKISGQCTCTQDLNNDQVCSKPLGKGLYLITIKVLDCGGGTEHRTIQNIPILLDNFNGETTLKFGKSRSDRMGCNNHFEH